MENQIELLVDDKKLTVFDDFVAHIYPNNLIEIIWSADLKQIEKSHLIQVNKVIKEYGCGKKMLVYFSTHDLLTISKESMSYGATEEAQEYTLANAVLANSLALKLIFNFFMRVYRPKTPTKSFSKRVDAIVWLLKKKKESDLVAKLN